MVLWVKALATKLDNLSSNPGAYIAWENQLTQIVFWSTHTHTMTHAHCSTHYKFECDTVQTTKKYILVDPGFISVAVIRCRIKKHFGEEKVSLATIPACSLSQQGSQGSSNLKSQWHHMYSQEQRGEYPAHLAFL